jgi:tRNA (guanine-N7-)-methyltransferase
LYAGGRLHFMTDVEAYFVETLAMLKDFPALQARPIVGSAEQGVTNFERKYRQEGRPIQRAEFEKTPDT